jgi:hypothetical protein
LEIASRVDYHGWADGARALSGELDVPKLKAGG